MIYLFISSCHHTVSLGQLWSSSLATKLLPISSFFECLQLNSDSSSYIFFYISDHTVNFKVWCQLWFLFSFCFLEIGSGVVQTGLKVTMQPRLPFSQLGQQSINFNKHLKNQNTGSAESSFRGPEFCSQHSHQVAYNNYDSSSRGSHIHRVTNNENNTLKRPEQFLLCLLFRL